jgi:hypothetical protein
MRTLRSRGLGVLCLAALGAAGLCHGVHSAYAEEWKRQQSFEDASKPYEGQKYKVDGYVDKKGDVQGGGLGCSAYASVVLHRMRWDTKWLEHYDLKVHQHSPEEIAADFSLVAAHTLQAAEISDKALVVKLIADGKLVADGLYLFAARKAGDGHVGFVRISADGTISQWHYSKLDKYDGLATGEFKDWYEKSMYKKSPVALFVVP